MNSSVLLWTFTHLSGVRGAAMGLWGRKTLDLRAGHLTLESHGHGAGGLKPRSSCLDTLLFVVYFPAAAFLS